MANRVLLDADGLKVSKAGQNVLTATGDSLLFDSEKIPFRLYMSGTMLVSAAGTIYSFPVGKAFQGAPLISCSVDRYHMLGLDLAFASGSLSTYCSFSWKPGTKAVDYMCSGTPGLVFPTLPFTLTMKIFDWDD